MAITLDYGKCAACGHENSKTLSNCRGCNALLPWAKGASPANSSSGGTKTRIGAGDIAWKAMSVQIVGGIIFLAGVFLWFGNVLDFYPTFRGLGYIVGLIGAAIWGAGSQMED